MKTVLYKIFRKNLNKKENGDCCVLQLSFVWIVSLCLVTSWEILDFMSLKRSMTKLSRDKKIKFYQNIVHKKKEKVNPQLS